MNYVIVVKKCLVTNIIVSCSMGKNKLGMLMAIAMGMNNNPYSNASLSYKKEPSGSARFVPKRNSKKKRRKNK